MTLAEMNQDLVNTEGDIYRLRAIVANLCGFIQYSGGENRKHLRMDLFKYEAMLSEAEVLKGKIQEKIKRRPKSTVEKRLKRLEKKVRET